MALTNGVVNGDHGAQVHQETSPYASPTIVARIGTNGTHYTLFKAMIEPYPGLQARINQKKPGSCIELPEVDDDIGHTFVHWIYTQNYNTLGLGGIPEPARAAAEFKKSVLTYFAARSCSLDQLEEITKAKMDQFSRQITVFDIQKIVAQVSSKLPPDEVWFSEHLYRWIKTMLQENDTLLANEDLLGLIGETSLFDKAIVRSIAELYSEKAAALKFHPTGSKAQGTAYELLTSDDVTIPIRLRQDALSANTADETMLRASDAPENQSDAVEIAPYREEGAPAHPEEAALTSTNDSTVDDPDTPIPFQGDGMANVLQPFEEVQMDAAVDGKGGELTRVDSASKATDSDVEAARAKTTTKKSKKKKGKKGGAEPATVV